MATLGDFLGVFNMSFIKGTVEKIDEGKVKTGHFAGKPYKTITLTTGNKITAFDVDNVTDVKVGSEYAFPVEESGQYTNVVGDVVPVEDVNADIKEELKPAEEVLPKVHTAIEERGFKNRISAIASAVDFVNNKLGSTAKESDCVETAKQFLEFING